MPHACYFCAQHSEADFRICIGNIIIIIVIIIIIIIITKVLI